jgi:hypothetical protein
MVTTLNTLHKYCIGGHWSLKEHPTVGGKIEWSHEEKAAKHRVELTEGQLLEKARIHLEVLYIETKWREGVPVTQWLHFHCSTSLQ